jgi:hypothetical protein
MRKFTIALLISILLLSSCGETDCGLIPLYYLEQNAVRYERLPENLIDENNTLTLLDFRNIKMGTPILELVESLGSAHVIIGGVGNFTRIYYQLSDGSYVNVLDNLTSDFVHIDILEISVVDKFHFSLHQYDRNCETSYARYLQFFEGYFDNFTFIERELHFEDILSLSPNFSNTGSYRLSPDTTSDMSFEDIVVLLGEPNGFVESNFSLMPFYQLSNGGIVIFNFFENPAFFTIHVIDPVGSVLETVYNYNLQSRQSAEDSTTDE